MDKRDISKKDIIFISIVLVIGVLSYSNTFDSPFVFDDNLNIADNPLIKNGSFFLNPSATISIGDPYVIKRIESRYVGFLTLFLNYRFGGLNVAGYHIVNISIHLLNAVLLYFFVLLAFKSPYLKASELSKDSRLIALFASLFFVSHPIQTQAVTYIVQRFASLATMFYLAALFFYTRFRLGETPKSSYVSYVLSLISAILAMKTKETAITLPLIIILYEVMFFKDSLKKRFLYLTPIVLTSLIIPLALMDFDKPFGGLLSDSAEITRLQTAMSRQTYLFTQMRVIITYLRLLFLPVGQNIDYAYPTFKSLLNPNVYLSFLVLFSIFLTGIYLYNRNRLVSFGIFWFFVTLSVESGLIPIADVIFEHRVYLPSIGFFIVFVSILFSLKSYVPNKKAIFAFLSLVCLALSISTYNRNYFWQSEIRIWEDSYRKAPTNVRACYQLAVAHLNNGETQTAVELFQKAIRINVAYVPTYVNLGSIYFLDGRYDEALKYYLIAYPAMPDGKEINHNIGLIYQRKGMPDKAEGYFKKAMERQR